MAECCESTARPPRLPGAAAQCRRHQVAGTFPRLLGTTARLASGRLVQSLAERPGSGRSLSKPPQGPWSSHGRSGAPGLAGVTARRETLDMAPPLPHRRYSMIAATL